MGDEEKKRQDDWQKAKEARQQEAARLREYANSPVTVDTSGQRDYMQEFMNSRTAKAVETPEQQAAREKRERTARKITALTDGLVALSNIAGAMGGATPAKQASLSAAHGKAVKEAAVRRKNNLQQYEIARRYAAELQQKQDAANAKRRDAERDARRKAREKADKMEYDLAKDDLAQQNKEAAQQAAKEKEEHQERHRAVSEGQAERRLGLSQQREARLAAGGGKSGKGSGYTQADYDEYARWKAEHPDEVEEIREDNAQLDMWGNPKKAVTNTIVKLTNAQMRKKYGQSRKTTKESHVKIVSTKKKGKYNGKIK